MSDLDIPEPFASWVIDRVAATKQAWHVVEGADIRDLLRRAYAGEDPDLLYVEFYANGERDDAEG